jgi:hypothetical protein
MFPKHEKKRSCVKSENYPTYRYNKDQYFNFVQIFPHTIRGIPAALASPNIKCYVHCYFIPAPIYVVKFLEV